MKWLAVAAMAACAVAQDGDKPQVWNGSIDVSQVDAFPKGQSNGNVHFGVIEDAKTWAGTWERLGRQAPEVDWKKNVVLFAYYAKWPGSIKLGEPVLEDGVVTYDVALDGRKLKKSESRAPGSESYEISMPRCHYDYTMRLQACAEVKSIRLVDDERELGVIALVKE